MRRVRKCVDETRERIVTSRQLIVALLCELRAVQVNSGMCKLLGRILLFVTACHVVTGKWITGKVRTVETWKFVSRFAFLDSGGKLQYSVEYPITDECCPSLVYYFDTIWPRVYPHKEIDCQAKMTSTTDPQHVSRQFRLVHNQTSNVSSHSCSDNRNTRVRHCSGTLRFHSLRNRWWFFVFSHCNSTRGLDITYDLVFTNGDSWEKHLSADELYILETDVAFLVADFATFLIALVCAKQLWMRDLLHRSYKIFLLSLCYELVAVLLQIGYYIKYLESGKEVRGIQDLGHFLDAASETIFAVLLILLAKGWTITRGRLSKQTQLKLAIFFTLYVLSYGILFIYDIQHFDPGLVMYRYDSPAGRGIVALRLVAWLWFNYAIYFSVKHYPEKKVFFGLFLFSLGIWFLAKPILVFLGYHVIANWSRTRICNGVDMTICLIGYIAFLYLLKPTTHNSNFPFHVCTTQVDLMSQTTDRNFEHTEAFTRLRGAKSGELETSLTELSKIPASSSGSEGTGA